MSKLNELPEGEGDASVLVATTAVNVLIRQINALLDMQVSPHGVATFKASEKNAVLDFAPLQQFIVQQVQAAVNGGAGGGLGGGGGSGGGSGGNPPGGGGGGGGGPGGSDFEYWKNNVSWTATCNGDGTITIKGA